jgi:hypothetical protein
MLAMAFLFNLYKVLLVYGVAWFYNTLIAYGEFCVADQVM